ncbi:MerR family transcriptional regulator [Vallitalea pronyensis]|uniref:MerR family transcriptional regulator n=1 Tax=Vallitalea pronyensis TaxID=1348613 RepID=A0A8J8MML0_9FIRM|nr:MerR family transcriptional regulator [Vallitalea pronyensis]QUI24244.1 MerR family transcriptional regulator [Vallitalea pronyensis]
MMEGESMGYTIGQTAEKVGLSTYTLRYYEKEGLIPIIHRNASGIRMYNDDDLFWIDFVRCLKDTGMSLAGIREIISLSMKGQSRFNSTRKKEILLEHRKQVMQHIEELQKSLEKIDNKIRHLEKEMV